MPLKRRLGTLDVFLKIVQNTLIVLCKEAQHEFENGLGAGISYK